MMKNIFRHIAGYTVGLSIFILLVPFSLFKISLLDSQIFDMPLIKSEIVRIFMAFPFFLAGAVFALWSNIYLLDIGKGGPMEGFNMAISPRTKKLVVTGPYRYCRNPMVFGAFMLYVSVSIYLTSIICLFILLIFLFLARVYLSEFEEKRLLKDFGDEYIDYKNKVSMIFPLKTIDNK